MAITLNGESRQFPVAPTIAQLVESLDLAGKRIAIERNGEIVPRSRYPELTVSDGDALEVVVAVGGG
ncbi:MAG: sulfur carrier protein ThiS [Betaproteobacteria bacterium]|nr:sulfur carrier protein ThiS [Betaproteobacteria bacterium]